MEGLPANEAEECVPVLRERLVSDGEVHNETPTSFVAPDRAAKHGAGDTDTTEEPPELPVTVALMVRPLVGSELVDGCRECVFANENEPSVTLVSEHKFTYDHVFHGNGQEEKKLYKTCVEPLVKGLMQGYNCTVLAYGQTGSGKTHTMGTAASAASQGHQESCFSQGDVAKDQGDAIHGVIPRVMRTLYQTIESLPNTTTVTLKVGFIEIHKEEIRDLLRPKNAVSLRDAPGGVGGVVLVGAREKTVHSETEMRKALRDGSETRATAATGMNHQSSRSHAVFTIHVSVESGGDKNPPDRIRAKMHLVDLAGSERAKRTGAEGDRLREGIQINKGLLALGNVISALGDDKRRRKLGAHVPYRDSKLTRLLQDSLGGNSRTVMVACISPADQNLDETLNTLKYANRARNIINTSVLGVDENASPDFCAARVAKLKRALSLARAEIAQLKLGGSGGGAFGGRANSGGLNGLNNSSSNTETSHKLEAMEHRAMLAEAEVSRLRADLSAAEQNVSAASAAELAACASRDLLALRLQESGIVSVESADDGGGECVIRSYLGTIQALRNESARLKNQLKASQDGRADPFAEDPAASYDVEEDETEIDDEETHLGGDIDEEEEVLEEDNEGNDLHLELASVERTLLAKETRMRAMATQAAEMQQEVDAAIARDGGGGAATAVGFPVSQDVELVREKYGRLLKSLETEKLTIAAERDTLLTALAGAARNGADARKAAEVKTKGRLLELEQRLREVSELAAKHKDAARAREKSDIAAKALHADIQRLRAARVELVRRMERATKEGIATQRESEKALQLAKKEARRHALAAQKAQSAVERQAAVLRRKTEEASHAREQLRALQSAAKANRRKPSGTKSMDTAPTATELVAATPAHLVAAVVSNVAPSDRAGPGTGLGLNARRQWIETEISCAVERAELRGALEEALSRRAALGRRVSNVGDGFVETELDSFVDDGIVDDEMRAVTTQIAALQERLYKSEEREDAKGGVQRWVRVRSLGEARSLLTILFNSAAAARRGDAGVNAVDTAAFETTAEPIMSAPETTLASTTVLSIDSAVLSIDPRVPSIASAPVKTAPVPLARTNSVVAEADAVLQALKKSGKEKRKKIARPEWQDVGPSTLVVSASTADEEKRRAKSPTGSETSAGGSSVSSRSDSVSSPGGEVSSYSASETTPTATRTKSTSELISTWELISASRASRQRADGLLTGSARATKETTGRTPLTNLSNADAPNATETVRKRIDMSFGVRDSVGGAETRDRVDCTPGQP